MSVIVALHGAFWSGSFFYACKKDFSCYGEYIYLWVSIGLKEMTATSVLHGKWLVLVQQLGKTDSQESIIIIL